MYDCKTTVSHTFRFQPSISSALSSINPSWNLTIHRSFDTELSRHAASNPVSVIRMPIHPLGSLVVTVIRKPTAANANRSTDLSPMQFQVVDFQPADSK